MARHRQRTIKAASKKATDAATHRLEDMTTHEVSLVDHAANMRKFLLFKDKEGKMPAPKNDSKKTEKQVAMVLPAEARQALIEGVADALEKLTGVTQALKESTVDENVEVPDELPRMIKEASDMLGTVAGQFLQADQEGEGKPVEEREQGNGDNAETEKARRLTPARVSHLKETRDMLIAFLNEIADGKDDGDKTEKSQSKDRPDWVTTMLEALTGLSANVKDMATAKEITSDKLAKAEAELAKARVLLDDPGESYSSGSEGNTVNDDEPKPFKWPDDMSDHVAKKARPQA